MNKNRKNTLSAIIILAVVNSSCASFGIQKRSHIPVGTVITSMLDPVKFMEMQKSEWPLSDSVISKKATWVPADGRSAKNTRYSKTTGNETVPDLRGQFLRGLNQFDNVNAPAAYLNGWDLGNRKLINGYSYQSQATALPTQRFALLDSLINDAHINTFQAIPYRNHQDGQHANQEKVRTVRFTDSWSKFTESGEGGDGNNEYGLRIKGTTTKRGFRPTVYGGDKETRPKNIAVYYYIKIN